MRFIFVLKISYFFSDVRCIFLSFNIRTLSLCLIHLLFQIHDNVFNYVLFNSFSVIYNVWLINPISFKTPLKKNKKHIKNKNIEIDHE